MTHWSAKIRGGRSGKISRINCEKWFFPWTTAAKGYEHKGEVIPDRVVIDELQQVETKEEGEGK